MFVRPVAHGWKQVTPQRPGTHMCKGRSMLVMRRLGSGSKISKRSYKRRKTNEKRKKHQRRMKRTMAKKRMGKRRGKEKGKRRRIGIAAVSEIEIVTASVIEAHSGQEVAGEIAVGADADISEQGPGRPLTLTSWGEACRADHQGVSSPPEVASVEGANSPGFKMRCRETLECARG
mmetsp:Transcript_27769/g.61278  ORF Transcript_27769/g.61278 Transcript_27769/m.61278 type:complete len:176 (-) Transcript_27769:25-552(-)